MAKKKNTTRRKPGRPKILITAQMIRKVETLASKGLTKGQIATSLGMSERSLYAKQAENTQFLQGLKKGRIKGLEVISNALFQSAKNGNVTAQIFYLKNRDSDNWSDRRVNENIERSAT